MRGSRCRVLARSRPGRWRCPAYRQSGWPARRGLSVRYLASGSAGTDRLGAAGLPGPAPPAGSPAGHRDRVGFAGHTRSRCLPYPARTPGRRPGRSRRHRNPGRSSAHHPARSRVTAPRRGRCRTRRPALVRRPGSRNSRERHSAGLAAESARCDPPARG